MNIILLTVFLSCAQLNKIISTVYHSTVLTNDQKIGVILQLEDVAPDCLFNENKLIPQDSSYNE
jgi:hypothetical protein